MITNAGRDSWNRGVGAWGHPDGQGGGPFCPGATGHTRDSGTRTTCGAHVRAARRAPTSAQSPSTRSTYKSPTPDWSLEGTTDVGRPQLRGQDPKIVLGRLCHGYTQVATNAQSRCSGDDDRYDVYRRVGEGRRFSYVSGARIIAPRSFTGPAYRPRFSPLCTSAWPTHRVGFCVPATFTSGATRPAPSRATGRERSIPCGRTRCRTPWSRRWTSWR